MNSLETATRFFITPWTANIPRQQSLTWRLQSSATSFRQFSLNSIKENRLSLESLPHLLIHKRYTKFYTTLSNTFDMDSPAFISLTNTSARGSPNSHTIDLNNNVQTWISDPSSLLPCLFDWFCTSLCPPGSRQLQWTKHTHQYKQLQSRHLNYDDIFQTGH